MKQKLAVHRTPPAGVDREEFGLLTKNWPLDERIALFTFLYLPAWSPIDICDMLEMSYDRFHRLIKTGKARVREERAKRRMYHLTGQEKAAAAEIKTRWYKERQQKKRRATAAG